MLDQNFCDFLEYYISRACANSTNEQLKHFWCDGVMLPNDKNEFSEKFINNKRKIVMTAFIGMTGQDKYELTIKFGKKAVSKYARGLEISECVPNPESNDGFDINIEKRKVMIQLE